MNAIASAHSKLQRAARLLDEAASDLATTDIPCRTADIRSIGDALGAICDVRSSIYEYSPELKPDDYDEKSPHPDFDRELTRIRSHGRSLLADNRPKEVITLLEAFIGKNPPGAHLQSARAYLDHIRRRFNIWAQAQ